MKTAGASPGDDPPAAGESSDHRLGLSRTRRRRHRIRRLPTARRRRFLGPCVRAGDVGSGRRLACIGRWLRRMTGTASRVRRRLLGDCRSLSGGRPFSHRLALRPMLRALPGPVFTTSTRTSPAHETKAPPTSEASASRSPDTGQTARGNTPPVHGITAPAAVRSLIIQARRRPRLYPRGRRRHSPNPQRRPDHVAPITRAVGQTTWSRETDAVGPAVGPRRHRTRPP